METKELQECIGYEFSDKSLLLHALSHSTYINEHHLDKEMDNERLEFLGDAVLENISSAFLYLNYPHLEEGKLSKLRASLVCEPTLAQVARDISLGKYLQLGKGEEKTGGRERDSILSDALEALIGAIFLDGGFTNAKEFVERFLLTDLDHKTLFYDSKTILQEEIQEKELELEYQLIKESGPDHDKRYIVQVFVEKQPMGQGMGRSKKAAEQQAAYETILQMRKGESGIPK